MRKIKRKTSVIIADNGMYLLQRRGRGGGNLLLWDKWTIDYVRLNNFAKDQNASTTIISSQAVGERFWSYPL